MVSLRYSLLFFSVLCAAFTFEALAKSGSGYTYYQKLTGEDSESDKGRWDDLYRKNKGYVFGREPAQTIVDNLALLPIGRVLDIAMGEGRNAVYLAKKGYDVSGVDISAVAIRKAKRLAHDNNVRITTIIADLNKYQIPADAYDVILVIDYLQRSLTPQIIRGLKPGGVLVMENDLVGDVKYDKTQNRDYMLKPGELRGMFKGLQEIKYQERDDGKRVYATLIARKPKEPK